MLSLTKGGTIPLATHQIQGTSKHWNLGNTLTFTIWMAELFANIEVNRESRFGVLLRLIVASLLLHIAILWTIAFVPAVRDTLNIAALIANTRFVNKPYNATQITDDVQLVQLADKFHYPEGYFAFESQQAMNPATTASLTETPGIKIISQAHQEQPVKQEPSPSPTPVSSPSPLVAAASPAGSPQANAKDLTPEEAQKKLEETATQNNLELPDETQINKKALKDFAAFANDLKNQGKLDFDKPFEIVIEAEMDDNGKLKNARFTKKSGDPNLVDLFGRMVSALNDSGFLVYLKPINKDNPGATIKFTIKQGDKEVLASVESEASSPDSARILAKALNAALVFGAGSRAGKDEAVVMRNTNASPDGKKVVVNFSMPRQGVVDLIKKQLEPGA